MQTFASFINISASVFTIGVQLLSLILIVTLITKKSPAPFSKLVSLVSHKAVMLSFIVALVATLGSLIYSDVIGYEPCKLCWFQRIFMYPLVILFGLALWKKDEGIRRYGLVLSSIGGCIALFHYVGQLGFNPFGLECLAIGYSASCSKNFVLQFGYITIPLMALSVFTLITLSLYTSLRHSQK